MVGPLFEVKIWKKIARRCNAKYICKSKFLKYKGFRPLFNIGMKKKNARCIIQKTFVNQNKKYVYFVFFFGYFHVKKYTIDKIFK